MGVRGACAQVNQVNEVQVKKTLLARGSNPSAPNRKPVVAFRTQSGDAGLQAIQQNSLVSASQLPPAEDRGHPVEIIRARKPPNEPGHSSTITRRELYFFLERKTGVSHFQIEAEPGGVFPVEQAAGLLAVHCLALGLTPEDYIVMVQVSQELLEGLTAKATGLLQVGRSVSASVKVTRREEEVLGGIMRTLANKEIATSLNLSERTVKFHVSSLLAKYGVTGRMALAREVMLRTSGATEKQSFARSGSADTR
jgi:DNA-binding CsgD family transcriptional regulator